MASLIMGLLAETSIHPGVGRNLGVIDLPVAREAATDYPVLVGSSLKGALKDLVPDKAAVVNELRDRLFGKHDDAGQLLISDARILLLPVRSLTGQYRWVTCPHILERFARDKRRAGLDTKLDQVKVEVGEFEARGPVKGDLFLEERQFKVTEPVPKEVLTEVAAMIGHETTRGRLETQLVVLSNDDFAWFARYGLSVQARNVLDENKKSTNLWYEETLPPDTVMVALIAERQEGQALKDFRALIADRRYLQAGGNETIGQGVFLVRCEPEA